MINLKNKEQKMNNIIDQLKNTDSEKFCNELRKRQGLPWNDGRIEEQEEFLEIEKVFKIINKLNEIGYKGDLYRVHSSYVDLIERVDFEKVTVLSKDEKNGSCEVIPNTEYNNKIVSFSKSYDFTDTKKYPKIIPDLPYYNFIHINTGNMYGIDVMKAGGKVNFEGEKEVLFPLSKEYLVEEYKGITPIEFKEIMDKKYAKK